MDSRTEGHVGVGPTAYVERFWIRAFLGVAIGAGDEPPHPIAFFDGLAAQLHFFSGYSLNGLHRRIVAQTLFGSPGDRVRVFKLVFFQ